MKCSIKIVKEGKLSFFLHCAQCFTYPSPFHFYFPPSPQFYNFPSSIFFHSLLLNFIVFAPPPPPHLIYIFSSIKKSTSYRPYIDTRLNFFFSTAS